ncbi:MAG: methionine synthase [Thermodesulfobacteriota bacterium]
MSSLAPLAATGIGSVPFTDAREIVALILETLPQIPYWPQMVQLGFLEDMTAQSARGLPALKLDLENRTVQMDQDIPRDEALAQFYEAVLSGDLTTFAFDEQDAQGFFALLDAVASKGCPCPALKGQLSGPVTFAGVVKDVEGKPILYDRELTQAVCSGLARKAAWQAEKFRQLGKEPIVFLDEPYLTGFGSAYLPISREEVTEILAHTLEEVRGATTGPVILGTHCCGNTDWSLLLQAPLDILSFDSYGYFESLRLYEQALSGFLGRGGWLAWGLVPTNEAFKQETIDSMWQRFKEQVSRLSADLRLGFREILSQSLLTPACGTGFMSLDDSRRVFSTLAELSVRGQEWLASM